MDLLSNTTEIMVNYLYGDRLYMDMLGSMGGPSLLPTLNYDYSICFLKKNSHL